MEMLKDPQALAKIGFEAGIGFIPFGGLGYKAVKAFTTDKTSPVRAAAAQRLINDPDPTTVQALVNALKDDKWMVRAAAVNALAKRDDRRQVAADHAAARRRTRDRPLQRGGGGDPVDP